MKTENETLKKQNESLEKRLSALEELKEIAQSANGGGGVFSSTSPILSLNAENSARCNTVNESEVESCFAKDNSLTAENTPPSWCQWK